MTTLVALASKHAVVIGSDSLGTESRSFLNPAQLLDAYFDPSDGYKLKKGADGEGEPLLKDYFTLMGEAKESVPYNQLLHVTKLFKLGDLPVAVAFTGVTAIGADTVRGLITLFCSTDQAVRVKRPPNYTVRTIATRLLSFLRGYYETAYPEEYLQQDLELLICGYDRNRQFPTICRANIRENKMTVAFRPGEFGISFAGQYDWIQRIVFGTDTQNRWALALRSADLLQRYRQKIVDKLESEGHHVDIPAADTYGADFYLFRDDWDLAGLDANWSEFSEQNAVDCVGFFLNIMIRAQDISERMPTVGGDVHIAVIRKDGYHPVTKEVWKFGEHERPIPEVGT